MSNDGDHPADPNAVPADQQQGGNPVDLQAMAQQLNAQMQAFNELIRLAGQQPPPRAAPASPVGSQHPNMGTPIAMPPAPARTSPLTVVGNSKQAQRQKNDAVALRVSPLVTSIPKELYLPFCMSADDYQDPAVHKLLTALGFDTSDDSQRGESPDAGQKAYS